MGKYPECPSCGSSDEGRIIYKCKSCGYKGCFGYNIILTYGCLSENTCPECDESTYENLVKKGYISNK